MEIIIQKFGGTSVATKETRALVLEKVRQVYNQGLKPVVVISAMGRSGDLYATDTLINLAKSACGRVRARELDQIMCCGEIISSVVMTATFQEAGLEAVTLTGGQAGIVTDSNFNNARAIKCDSARILKLLAAGKIPVVCGFQGVTADGELTTLGRGGSDTTAAILGAALDAREIEIYTDVEGIMTADPKMVANAKKLSYISYAEVCQLAHQGAKVIHPRAVEIAMQKNIPLIIKSTFSDAPGTTIANFNNGEAKIVADLSMTPIVDRVATGVTYLPGIVQFKIDFDCDTAIDATHKVFKTLAESGISVDLINIHPKQILFTVSNNDAPEAKIKLEAENYPVETVADCAKVSVVGGGMREAPGVMANFIEALARNEIAILQTVDSHTSISALIFQNDVQEAVIALHENFGLAN